jgi:hypothetical protein
MSNNPTAKQRRLWGKIAALGCLPCFIDGTEDTPAGISHKHAPGYRDHDMVFPACPIHHLEQHAVDGIPNRHKNPIEFKNKYGDDDYLCALTMEKLTKVAQ